MRECGILLPITSIPSPYGIGGFSKAAYDFVDWLWEAGQQYWQVLPFGPTGYGDSPYQSFGAFAGNPYFIDLDTLAEEKLLTKAECLEADCGQYPGYVDYERIYKTRYQVLRKAFARWKAGGCKSSQDLCPETKEYCVYMAVKNQFQGKSWAQWEEDIRLRKPETVKAWEEELADEILFYEFQQLKFQEQWKKLKDYANSRGVRIIGDIPIYVAFDSADSWFHPELFQYNEDREPDFVAGCPPDGFSPTGSSGATPCTSGTITKRRDTTGGSAGWPTASAFMMWCGWTISGALTSIIPFPLRTIRRREATGRKDRAWSCLTP